MSNTPHFKVCKYRFVLDDNKLIERMLIQLVDANNVVHFTNFHEFIKAKTPVSELASNGNNRFYFVAQFLNYVYFDLGIPSLTALTIDHVKTFLNAYGEGKLPNDSAPRKKNTVDRCINVLCDFLTLYIDKHEDTCKLKIDHLYETVLRRSKTGAVVKTKVLQFEVRYTENKKLIWRDIPNKAFDLLFQHILTHHPRLSMAVSQSAFAGLRPSASLNTRREDSPLGPGILFDYVDGEIFDIQIDIRDELNLRSDMVSVGKLKKPRMQHVHPMFFHIFQEVYDW